MTPNEYLAGILVREAIDTGPQSPVRGVQGVLAPILGSWGGGYLSSISPSGSVAKGTANRSGTDIDLFLSLTANRPNTLKATTPGEKGEPPVLAERFTFHDLRAKSASDDELEAATERLAHDDPRTTHKVYRRKPRRAIPGAKILDASGDIGQ